MSLVIVVLELERSDAIFNTRRRRQSTAAKHVELESRARKIRISNVGVVLM